MKKNLILTGWYYPEYLAAAAAVYGHYKGAADVLGVSMAGKMPTKKQIAALSSYDYPGNVRELIAILKQAKALGEDDFAKILAAHAEFNKLLLDGLRTHCSGHPAPGVQYPAPGTNPQAPGTKHQSPPTPTTSMRPFASTPSQFLTNTIRI